MMDPRDVVDARRRLEKLKALCLSQGLCLYCGERPLKASHSWFCQTCYDEIALVNRGDTK
jgi:hypothetical protein